MSVVLLAFELGGGDAGRVARSWANGRTIAAVRVVLAARDRGPDGRLVCPLCDREIRDGQAVDIDHAVGRAVGGGSGLGNLRLAHMSCNRRRGGVQYRAARIAKATPTTAPGRWQRLANEAMR